MKEIFDYRTLRLIIGIIAFSLPFVVSGIAGNSLPSISDSYFTEARDMFVGMLFVVGAFLFAYNGHSFKQAAWSKIAGVAAIFVAIFPTTCVNCEDNLDSYVHYIAAGILFSVLTYFCLFAFRKNIKGKPGKKALRSKIYFACGLVMASCMVSLLLAKLGLEEKTLKAYEVVYWGETIALAAYGLAWIVAGKCIPFLVDPDESLKFSLQHSKVKPAE